MDELSTLTYSVADGVANLRINRPDAANAVNPALASDLRQVMVEIQFDPNVCAVSVTAAGKVFCGGGDLDLMSTAGDRLPHVGAGMLIDLHAAISIMNSTPKPFVAGVRGAAGGAGLSLVSAFDFVISAESAKYTMAYTKVGLTPDGTGSYFLARHIGLRRTLDLTLTNRVLSAAEAESWGLVNRVVPDDEVDDAAARLAGDLAAASPHAIGLAKKVMYYGADHGLADAAAFEANAITHSMGQEEARTAIAKFQEAKRRR